MCKSLIQCSAHSQTEGQHSLERRGILAILSTLAAALPPSSAFAAPTSPSPITLKQTFTSSEGFQFKYPSGWVVAYDRSGGRTDGAVAAIGDFKNYLVISIFRTIDAIPQEVKDSGRLTEDQGRELCIEVQRQAESTMWFQQVHSQASSDNSAYDFEYEIETCRGEIQEGAGGVLRCLNSDGRKIPVVRRRHVGRAIVVQGRLLTINATASVDTWPQVEGVMRAVVESFGVST